MVDKTESSSFCQDISIFFLNNIIIPLVLVEYRINEANSAVHESLAISYLTRAKEIVTVVIIWLAP